MVKNIRFCFNTCDKPPHLVHQERTQEKLSGANSALRRKMVISEYRGVSPRLRCVLAGWLAYAVLYSFRR